MWFVVRENALNASFLEIVSARIVAAATLGVNVVVLLLGYLPHNNKERFFLNAQTEHDILITLPVKDFEGGLCLQ